MQTHKQTRRNKRVCLPLPAPSPHRRQAVARARLGAPRQMNNNHKNEALHDVIDILPRELQMNNLETQESRMALNILQIQ